MIITILAIVALIFSAILHEYAHGYAAYLLGDNTAKNAGRLTLNPIAHLDPIGSVLLPVLLVLSKANFFIAWAKPVPYNPYNLRDQKTGDLKVALAGPGTNLAIAVFFGLLARFLPLASSVKYELARSFLMGDAVTLLNLVHGSMFGAVFALSTILVFVNLALMVFNLLPIPPLDGSKVIYTLLPQNLKMRWLQLESYSFILLIVLVMSGVLDFVFAFVLALFSLLVGI